MRAYLLSLIFIAPTVGAMVKTACPTSLPAESLTVRAPSGWTGYTPGSMRLTYAAMMAGPPDSMTYLVPFRQKSGKVESSSTWLFPDAGEKWLQCNYDGSTAIQISKRLDDAATECTVRYAKSKFGGIASAVAECTAKRD